VVWQARRQWSGPVARTIVGEGAFTGDSVGFEPGDDSLPERCAGDALFIAEDL
jgi:hypothetical protein